MKKFPVALQLYSVRDDMENDFEGTLRKVKAMGYDGVELAGLYGNKPAAEIKRICDEVGLEPISAHIALELMEEDPEGMLSHCKQIGCKQVVIPFLCKERRPGTENFSVVPESAYVLGNICKSMGLLLAYHNHEFEFMMLDGKYALDVLYDSVPADLLQVQLDTCWAKVAGVDPVAYIKKYAGRAYTVHLKDFVGQQQDNMYALLGDKDDTQKQGGDNEPFGLRPVGYGKQNFPAILQASEEAGIEWLIVEQDHPSMGKTPLECAEMSINYLKTLI
jgi:sugar phosphate isomerase/epimerase